MNIELLNWSRGVIADQEITTTQKTIAWAIMIHANLVTRLCNPGTTALVKATGLTERCVWIGIKALADRGWLINHHGGGKGQKNDFQFNFPPHLRQKITESEGQTLNRKVPNPESEGTQTLNRKVGTLYTGNIEEKSEGKYSAPEASDLFGENNSIDDKPAAGPPSASKPNDHDTGFEDFWKSYPHKTARAHARKAWEKAIKAEQPGVIIAAAKRQALIFAETARKEGKEIATKFTKHPATWLNAESWADDRLVNWKPSSKGPERIPGII